MRYVAVTEGDKTEAELRFGVQVNTWGVNELADAVAAASEADIDALVQVYLDEYEVADELRPGASATSRCATAPRSRSACGRSSRRAASARSRRRSRTSAR
jgi:L-arabinose isomerase